MKRREFITLVGGAAAAWPLAARAQQAGKVWRIGVLSGLSREAYSRLYARFHEGMRELGYVEGKDFVSEWRSAEGNYERFPELADELTRLKVDVIMVGVTAALPALKRATTTIPIVMAYSIDPVGIGVVASLARPGGNITGLASSSDDSAPKQLELLTAAVPNASRIGFLGNPNSTTYSSVLKTAQNAAKRAGLSLLPIEARSPREIEDAFIALARERVPAVMFAGDSVFYQQQHRIAELALVNRLATMFSQREYAVAGGLMSYGEDVADFFRRAASFVDKIFKGAKPSDLPIEQPTKFNLVINLKTAKALGLTVPDKLLVAADELIE
jgi:putative ABC transport system substrate-binding protein